MPLKTAEQYLESLRDGRTVYYRGKLVPDVTRHPVIGVAAEHAAIDYRMAHDAAHRELCVVEDEAGEYSRYYHIPRSPDDLLQRSRLIERATTEGATLVVLIKEIGTDALCGLLRVTPAVDQQHGTGYAPRVRAYYEYCRDNDLAVAVAQTDVKGDRSLKPSAQVDPDLYVRIVDRNRDGIVVRGAKAHTSVSTNANELIVLPTRALGEADRDYAVSFAIPMNTPGLLLLASAFDSHGPQSSPAEQPISARHKMMETTTVFDDVFVPWERVFLAGEYDFAGPLALAFVEHHRFTAISYKLPLVDALVGSALLLADMNGIAKAGHVREKVVQLISYAETLRGLTHHAALMGRPREEGVAAPDPLYVNMAKYHFAHHYHDAVRNVQDIAGGALVTGPGAEDLDSEATAPLYRKYYAGHGVGGEERLKALTFVKNLVASEFGAYQEVLAVHAEGSLEAEKQMVARSYDRKPAVALVRRLAGLGAAALLAVGLTAGPAEAQDGGRTVRAGTAPAIDAATSIDWPRHNLDLRNTRFAAPDRIDTSNVGSLELKWRHQTPMRSMVRSTTPLVIDGIMYFNSGSLLTALDAATGEPVWTFEADPPFSGGGRGPSYADGRIYAFGPTIMYAVDARTGELIETFGDGGQLQVARAALTFKYPDNYPPNVDTEAIGFAMTNPPAAAGGRLFVGLPFSEGLVPGGLLAALDADTGVVEWVFNTVPQGPRDSGWEIAKDTWSGERRYGGGVWMQPAIDEELGMIYVNAANPSPNYDGSSRLGQNLFTNSMLGIDIESGELKWYFQTLHHDIWDWDLASGPILFDVMVDGRPVKGVASLGKTCYVYMLDRETGEPIHPIVEHVVPTNTDVPGEQVWPTQPIPQNALGVWQEPFCQTYPMVEDPELAPRVRQMFHPYQVSEFVITAPGNTGGANYGSPSFSPRTGLLYVTGKNDAWSIKVKVVGDTMEPGPGYVGHFGNIEEAGQTGVTATSTLAAYDPATGELVWYAESPGSTNGGNLVTAGDVVFQGGSDGGFYGFDAETGERLFTWRSETGIHASPLTYQVNGEQYVAIAAVNAVLVFGLP